MTEKYTKFVDAETEISLDESESGRVRLELPAENETETNDVVSLVQRPRPRDDDIGPVNGLPEEDLAANNLKYQRLDKEKEENLPRNDLSKYTELGITEVEYETRFGRIRMQLARIVDHLSFRLLTVVLVILDLVVVIVDLSKNDTSRSMEVLSLTIMTYFVLECVLRLAAHGPAHFLSQWIEIVDAVIIMVSFVFTILPIALGHLNTNIAFIRLLVAARLIRIILIVRLITERKNLERATRKVVSQNKRRYQKDGFDLDLCYVTDRVIAMSFPSTGLMALYRNPIKEVANFMNLKHKDHYLVFNLCSERMYDETVFHNRVVRYRIDDHNVPKLKDLLDFVRIASEWLAEDERNVIAIHCKGGKGRTGTFICTWLVENGTFDEAKDSLEYFGDKRTDLRFGSKYQGVETPSQSRYVGYYEKIKRLHFGNMPPEQTLKLTSMYLKSVSAIGCGDGRDLTCKIITEKKIWIYDLGKQDNCQVTHDIDTESVAVNFADVAVLLGDIKVMFFCSDKTMPRGYDNCLFYFWFHTAFIEDGKLFLTRQELDNAHKRKTWKVFMDDFSVTLLLQKVPSVLT